MLYQLSHPVTPVVEAAVCCGTVLFGGFCRYANGDDYTGYFQSGQRCGHGVLQEGHHLRSFASIYVGEWLNDKRHGYGVQDDILRGMVQKRDVPVELVLF